MKNPYQTLGIPATSSDEEIKAAYIKLAMKHHPDKCGDNANKDAAEELMKEINIAYNALMKNEAACRDTDSANQTNQTNHANQTNQAKDYYYYREPAQRKTIRPPASPKQKNNTLIAAGLGISFTLFLIGLFPRLVLGEYFDDYMSINWLKSSWLPFAASLVLRYLRGYEGIFIDAVKACFDPDNAGYNPEGTIEDFYSMLQIYSEKLDGQNIFKKAIPLILEKGDVLFIKAATLESYRVQAVTQKRIVLKNANGKKRMTLDTLLDRSKITIIGVVFKQTA